MTTDDLLQLTAELLRDTRKPLKWSDDTKARYLNEAQNLVASRTMFQIDDTLEIETEPGVSLYNLDPRVLMVFDAYLPSGIPLQPSTDAWTGRLEATGIPSRIVFTSAYGKVRLYPTPDLVTTIQLRVARSPTPLTTSALTAESEIPERWQNALADWAAYRCFTHDDADGRNDGAAALCKDRFDAAVREYKAEQYRLQTGNYARANGRRIR